MHDAFATQRGEDAHMIRQQKAARGETHAHALRVFCEHLLTRRHRGHPASERLATTPILPGHIGAFSVLQISFATNFTHLQHGAVGAPRLVHVHAVRVSEALVRAVALLQGILEVPPGY